MKHAILGAGAVGGLVGAALAHEGDRVTLLVRPQTHTQHPGMLRLTRSYDTIEAPVRIETRLAEPVDVLWLAVKAHQLVAALRAVPPDVVTTTVVPLLNGIEHVNLLRLRFNHERVVPATILVESRTHCSWSDRPAFSICPPGTFNAGRAQIGGCRLAASACRLFV